MHDVRRNGGGRGLCGGPEKRVDGAFPGRSQSFLHQRRPVDDCSPGRGGMAQNGRTAEQEAEHFIAKWTVAEKVKAGLRHAVVCPNVTGRTKEKIAQGKRARAGSLALVDKPQVARTCILRAFGLQMSCRLFLVLRLFFVLLRSRLFAFVEAATLRSIVLRYAGATIATCFFLSFFLSLVVIWRCRFFRVFILPFPLSLCMEIRVRRTFFPHKVTTGWIFDISLCENSINQSNQSLPSCLWSLRILPSLLGSRLTILYRDASSVILQPVNQWLDFTYSRSHAFCYGRNNTNSNLVENRTHDFRTSRCAGYLLDHQFDK